MSSEKEADREVLDAAIELHSHDEARRDFHPPMRADGTGVRTTEEAAADLGIGPEYLARAQAEVARRRAEAAAAAQRKRTWRNRLLGAGAVLALGLGGWAAFRTPAADPWTDGFEDRSHWTLEVSPGTRASVRFETDGSRGAVLAATVDQATPRADGTWFVNVDGRGLGGTEGLDTVVVELKGTLTTARVFLEAGADERWRSPPVALTADWERHELPMTSFEYQRRTANGWRVESWEAPSEVDTVSVKLGHYVNDAAARGTVWMAEVGAK